MRRRWARYVQWDAFMPVGTWRLLHCTLCDSHGCCHGRAQSIGLCLLWALKPARASPPLPIMLPQSCSYRELVQCSFCIPVPPPAPIAKPPQCNALEPSRLLCLIVFWRSAGSCVILSGNDDLCNAEGVENMCKLAPQIKVGPATLSVLGLCVSGPARCMHCALVKSAVHVSLLGAHVVCAFTTQ
jgi:hypothetical protein